MHTRVLYINRLNYVLHYYVGILWPKINHYDVCVVLVDKIIPLIRAIDRERIQQWENEAHACVGSRGQQESGLLAVCKEVFGEVKRRLEMVELASEQSIKQRLCIIDSVLEFRHEDERAVNIGSENKPEFICSDCGLHKSLHRVYVMPSYAWGLEQEIKRLCDDIFDLGRHDLLEGLVEIGYKNEYPARELGDYYCSKACGEIHHELLPNDIIDDNQIRFDGLTSEGRCHRCDMHQSDFLPIYRKTFAKREVPYISAFTFVPSIAEQGELDPVLFFEKKGAPLWLAWNMLLNIEGCLNCSRDYLRKKYLQYGDVNNCIRSARLLQEHAAWVGIKSIKDGKKTSSQKKIVEQETAIYSRKRIKKWLGSIMTALPQLNMQNGIEFLPGSLELDMPKEGDLRNDLRLKIEWQPGIMEVVVMHIFQETVNTAGNSAANCAEKFIRDLCSFPDTVVRIGDVAGANAKKHLARVGIKGILKDLFIEVCLGKQAKLRSKRIDLSNKPEYILKKVRIAIQRFDTVEWL